MDPTILPSTDYTIQNILHQHTSKFDGYGVLYAMLKEHHPLLKCNAHVSSQSEYVQEYFPLCQQVHIFHGF